MRRALPFLVVILALTSLGAMTWLTHHPESAVIRHAEDVPFIGPWAAKFREAYRHPVEFVEGEEADGPIFLFDQPMGASSPPWTGTPEYLWVLEGTQILAAPTAGAPPLRRMNVITNLARLERRGDWFRVWYHGQEGWVQMPDYQDDVPPLGSDPDPVLPLPPRAPDAERLKRARALLGEGAQELTWSGYRIYTDCWDSQLLDRMGRVLIRLEATYRERYGLEPLGTPLGAVVLYQRQEDLEQLQGLEGLAGLPATGHAARGVAALAVGQRPQHEVVSTLIHEVAHLIHRRALGPALPPWLDEGLSDDLANLLVAEDGSLQSSGWSGRRVEAAGRVRYEGALASLRVSARAVRRYQSPDIAELLAYDWEAFVVTRRSRLHYDLAAFFIRYVLDDSERAKAFRAFLAATAGGESISRESVRLRLGSAWPTIQARFQTWLEQQAAATTPSAPGVAAASETPDSAPALAG